MSWWVRLGNSSFKSTVRAEPFDWLRAGLVEAALLRETLRRAQGERLCGQLKLLRLGPRLKPLLDLRPLLIRDAR